MDLFSSRFEKKMFEQAASHSHVLNQNVHAVGVSGSCGMALHIVAHLNMHYRHTRSI